MPSTIVVDASIAVWAVLPIVSTADATAVFSEWDRLLIRRAAPMLWLAECVTAIRRAVSVGAVSPERALGAIDSLFALGVETMPMSQPQCRSAFGWAERLGQSRAYDGFYLALAEDLNVEFWTADRRLANAARGVGATWVHAIGN